MFIALVFFTLSLVVLFINIKISKNLFYPPAMFCFVWTIVFLSYVIFLSSKTTFIYELDISTLLIFFIGEILFSVFGFLAIIQTKSLFYEPETNFKVTYYFDIILLFILLGLFPFYLNAVMRIVDGSKFAKVNFYLALRHEFVFNNANLGIWDYLNTFSIFAFAFFQYKLNFTKQPEKKTVIAKVYKVLFYVTVFTYAFLTTGRTSFVFLLTIYLVIKVTAKTIKRYHVTLVSIVFLIIFIANAFILGKGASVDDSVTENTSSILDNFTIYFLGGVYGFDSVVKSGFILDYGENVFRFFIAVAYALGISNVEPRALVMPYITTPILSNVYTVYYNYFKDFSYLGLCFNCIYSFIHTIFYNKTRESNRFINIYFFSTLMYPLVMSFFQDQYMSLFSTWIQLTFYGLIASFFVTSEKKIVV